MTQSLANACLIKHFNRLGQLDSNLDQLRASLCDELANATREVVSDYLERSEDLDEEAYLRMLGFNPKVFLHTVENIDGVKKQTKQLLKTQIAEVLSRDEDHNQS